MSLPAGSRRPEALLDRSLFFALTANQGQSFHPAVPGVTPLPGVGERKKLKRGEALFYPICLLWPVGMLVR
jgi:hypothetical protein